MLDPSRDTSSGEQVALSPTTVMPPTGRRPPLQTRMHHYFEASCDRTPDALALDWEGGRLTYAELDARANRLAHHLLAAGPDRLRRVCLLVDRSADLYVALLGTMKTGAAFVPIDPASPGDRVTYVVDDSGADLLLTTRSLVGAAEGVGVPVLLLDDEQTVAEVAARPADRPDPPAPDGEHADDPGAYVIYTSGSSGRPKGVDVAQSSICNFIHVITQIYDVQPDDRVYQGMTVAFDFAIEEVWPTWATGATLVPGPVDGRRVGAGLTDYLEDHGVTVLYCVPTVLSTIERNLPAIRALMVGGEACPAELVERWAPGRRMLNTYGPTEATVTCTWGVLLPGRPVTIGVPVTTYTAYVLDEQRAPVPEGEVGELCIGGPGVARGYLNRPELTADRFIHLEHDRAAGRIYRTGDLCRVQEDGEIVYLGRADAEVKIRGHRVDLGEIESVIMRHPAVPSAAVKHLKESGSPDDLAAYLVLSPAAAADVDALTQELWTQLRETLPAYMVPAFFEVVDELPMLPSGKVDRPRLPDPTSRRMLATSGERVPPATPQERWLAEVWADAFGLELDQVSVEADFFEELGGHSLVAATVVSRLRQDPRGARLSVLDLYDRPTVRGLAELVADDVEAVPPSRAARLRGRPTPTWQVWSFGLAQLVLLFLAVAVGYSPIALLYWWFGGRVSFEMLQLLVLSFPVVYLLERWVVPVAATRLLGRGIEEGSYGLYGLVHLRLWAVGKAMTFSPLPMLAGSPLALTYLRWCGATVSPGAHLATAGVNLPSMLTVEEGATVGYATLLEGWSIDDGRIRVGRVEVSADATVSANCVLTGPCRVGAGALLREQSSVGAHESVPSDETWRGSPARRRSDAGDPWYEAMATAGPAPRRWTRNHLASFVLGVAVLELVPLLAALPVVVIVWWALLTVGVGWALLTTVLLTGPVFVVSVCCTILLLRRFALPSTPVGIHPLRSKIGVEKWFGDKLFETSLLLTNSMYSTLFTPMWLRRLGADVGPRAEVSTIANIDPDLLTVGEESFIADMASVGSSLCSNHHLAFRPTVVEPRSFVGNAAFLPCGSRLGSGSLLGVLSTPPGPDVPADSSWLGSPSFRLRRRETWEGFTEEQTFHPPRRLVVGRYLVETVRIVAPSSLLATSVFGTLWVASRLVRAGWGPVATVLGVGVTALLASLAVVVAVAAVKWLVVGRYRPRVEPLWSMFVRRSELVTGLYEAAAVPALLTALSGTPMLGALLRLYGVRVGRRALLDSTYVTEFDLVRVGADSVVGPHVSLQTHLFEDRVMKMDVLRIGRGSVLGSRSIVLYATDVGASTRLSPLTLAMKGESLPAGSDWTGIPARPSAQAVEPDEAPEEGEAVGLTGTGMPQEGAERGTVVPGGSGGRVVGLDVARGLALVGMFSVHTFTAYTADYRVTLPWLLASGTASALFAILAGISIGIMTGRTAPYRGTRMRAARGRLVVRAVMIMALGLVLGWVVPITGAGVILPYLGLLFLAAVPFVSLRARPLLVLSVGWILVAPLVSQLLRQGREVPEPHQLHPWSLVTDPLQSLDYLTVSGLFPALTWFGYILVGLGLSRLDLNRRLIPLLGAVGLGLALSSTWLSGWLMRVWGVDALARTTHDVTQLDEILNLVVWGGDGTLPADSWWWLAVAAPHTGTQLDLLRTTGWAIVVITACLALTVVAPRLLEPLATVGRMSLTMYSLHLVLLTVVGDDYFAEGWAFLLHVGACMLFAGAWSTRFSQGPLEWLVRAATRLVVPGAARPAAGREPLPGSSEGPPAEEVDADRDRGAVL